jgi:ATP/maltotriose-dependent transcriptional regulator MalT/DNA-binding SARP family transcriptional activator
MNPPNLIAHTRLSPPRLQKYILPRPRLTARLLDVRAHRLAIVQAGTGYGKSTALAALAHEPITAVWYRLDREDADPQRFLLHLIQGFRDALPGLSQTPDALLEEWGQNRAQLNWTAVTDSLLGEVATITHQPLLLILDDVHLIQESGETIRILDRVIGRAATNLHLILSSRYPIPLPSLVQWRVRGELLEIDQAELAFTPTEIDTLFRQEYGYALTLEQADLLVNRIEGWPIALHLIWQRLQRDGGASLPQALWQLSGSASDLFVYLTQEVLAQQPEDVQAFLRLTAVLRDMSADNCDHLRRARDSRQMLRYLRENGLFVVNVGEGHWRYHHLFRDILRNQLEPAERQQAHQRAAVYFQQLPDHEEAIYHWLAATAYNEAAELLEGYGRDMVRVGRLNTLANWIGSLPPETLSNHPPLLVYLGDIARLHSHFDDALDWYKQAEQFSRSRGNVPALGQSLRGQARVYLDLVNTHQAEHLLQEAIKLADGSEDRESRARLLELLAENLLNQGKAAAAQAYQVQARELRDQGHGTAELPVRLLLRTGKLDEARQLLETQAELEQKEPVQRPRAHRETHLLLSLILSFQGEQEAALQTAVAATERGQQLDSHFIISVGYSRQGHAWNVLKTADGYAQARHCFETALQISQSLEVARLRVEPNWGLCQIAGFTGDLDTAGQLAEDAIAIARRDGDEWVEMCVRTTLGAAYALHGNYPAAADWLAQAMTGFRNCSDTFGETAARLWLCMVWLWQEDETRLKRDLAETLALIRQHHYEFLLTRRTMPGPPDPRQLVPLLIYARDHEQQAAFAGQLLAQLGLPHVQLHPGYRLRIHSLGPFRLWRGTEEVPASEWKRKKARQLLQLFLTHHGRMLHRDQICELLWPELTPDGALRDFKIAFSAMCNVLEPRRKRNAPSAYVLRDGSRYGLDLSADVELDVLLFEQAIAAGQRVKERSADKRASDTAVSHFQTALSLYEGDFLQAYPYDEWCHEERLRLRTLFLQTAEQVATYQTQQQQWAQVVPLCQKMIQLDDCWEPAYQHLMTAHHHLGHRPQAMRVYQQCVAALQRGLGIEPTAVTRELYELVIGNP